MSCGCIPRRKNRGHAKVGPAPCEFSSIAEAPSHDDVDNNKPFGNQKSPDADDESTRPATIASRVTTPPPFTVEDVADGNYGIELRRDRASQHWGLVWESQVMEKSCERVVEKITPGSITCHYNRDNPSRPVNKGDTLVKVNGRGGRMEIIGLELRKNHIFLEFRPHSSSGGTDSGVADYQIPADLPSSHRVACLQRRPGERWGIMWDSVRLEKDHVRVVDSITAGGLAEQWNKANPDQAILPGYRLLKVNGVEGRIELHGVEFAKKDRVVLEFIISGFDS